MSSQRYRRKKKKRLSGFFLHIILLFSMVVALMLGATLFFKVETLEVEGNFRYSQEEIIAASGIELGTNLFLVGYLNLEETLCQKLPYLESITLKLDLPTGLKLVVQEQEDLVALSVYDSLWIMSLDGKLLEQRSNTIVTDLQAVAETSSDQLPQPYFTISGLVLQEPAPGQILELEEGKSYRKTALLHLLEALEEQSLLDQVMSLDMSQVSHITFKLQQRFRVNVPFDGDYAYKLRALLQAVEHTEDYETGVMDLTSNSYAVLFSPD